MKLSDVEEAQALSLFIRKSFYNFLKLVKISEPPSISNRGGAIPFKLWKHLEKAIGFLLNEKLIIWLKSRQIGASWLVAAYVMWFALTKKGARIFLFSVGEDEAFELLAKCRFIYESLPKLLKYPINPDSRSEMGFPVMESTIKAMASTPSAGVGYTASIIVGDELEQHPYATENFLQAKPCVDSSGGQYIGIFTVDKRKKTTLAKNLFIGAREGKNDFKWLFDAYDVRPGRDEEWYEKTKRGLSPEELGGLTPELYMEQNYPRSIEEALRVGGTASAFDQDVLSEMMLDTRNPIKLSDSDINYSITNIYKPFLQGHFYISTADIAHGSGKDYTIAGVMDVKTGEVVADIMRNDLSVESFAEHYMKLLRFYRNPKCCPEDNDRGHAVILMMEQAGYKHWIYQDEKKTKPGWHTGKANRSKALEQLIPAINNRQITVYNKKGVEQLGYLIRNVEKNGRIEAVAGGNDDYAMMLAIAWANKDKVSMYQDLKPFATLKF